MLLPLDKIAGLDQSTNFHRFLHPAQPEFACRLNRGLSLMTRIARILVAVGGWYLSESEFTGLWDFRVDGMDAA